MGKVRFASSVKLTDGPRSEHYPTARSKQTSNGVRFSSKDLEMLLRAVSDAYAGPSRLYRVLKVAAAHEVTSFYRCISVSLYGTPARSAGLRQSVLKRLKRHRKVTDREVVKAMKKSNTLVPGEIRITSGMIERPIKVFTKGSKKATLYNDSKSSRPVIRLMQNPVTKLYALMVKRKP